MSQFTLFSSVENRRVRRDRRRLPIGGVKVLMRGEDPG